MLQETLQLNDAVEIVQNPVVEAGSLYEHTMALHFDPEDDGIPGVIRCIVNRTGNVHVAGFVDRSQLHVVEMESQYEATIGPELDVSGTEEVVSDLAGDGAYDFLGLEDPNVWRSRDGETLHLYCTIPLVDRDGGDVDIYLGHAEGTDLNSLRMTEPVLEPLPGVHGGAKEVAIAPEATDGSRYNLVESNDTLDGTTYSVLRTVAAPDPGGPWEYDGLALHPARDGYTWCGGHVSPGPFLPREFIDVGENRRVGLLNGREPNRTVDGEVRFGEFAIGLMVYDYEDGVVEWISEEPVVRDPDAQSITFASAFEQTEADRGVIYAHVDDSFVRAYRVDADLLSSYLPDIPSRLES